jgi:hypothetical protein
MSPGAIERIAGPDKMAETEFPMVHVLAVKPVDGLKLWLRFDDGWEGVCDLSNFIACGGPMVEPLRDEGYFARVFIEMGAPTWPNGLDLDPINLYMEMKKAGRLRRVAAA